MFDELRIALTAAAIVTFSAFTIPVALTAGLNVAQKIGLVDCVAPQVQNTK